ncbi:MAG: hypothetical protein H8D87_06420 [Deltaproteobacteria bacterium]|nr:hypothetical protein [Candidatus Desulfobacula maris]
MLIEINKSSYKKIINVNINSQRKGKERKGKEINTLYDELKKYLQEKILPEFKPTEDHILDFYKYRMTDKIKGKKQPYETTAGIDGLFRDLKTCFDSGYGIMDCCQIAKENGWLTPRLQYFENIKVTPLNGKTLTEKEILEKHGL